MAIAYNTYFSSTSYWLDDTGTGSDPSFNTDWKFGNGALALSRAKAFTETSSRAEEYLAGRPPYVYLRHLAFCFYRP